MCGINALSQLGNKIPVLPHIGEAVGADNISFFRKIALSYIMRRDKNSGRSMSLAILLCDADNIAVINGKTAPKTQVITRWNDDCFIHQGNNPAATTIIDKTNG